MKTTRNILIASAALSLLTACGTATDPDVGVEPQTDTFRQALPAAGDVTMEYAADGTGSVNALEGERSLIAGMTATAVVGTNAHMIRHFALMNAVSELPPTAQGEDFRVWQGTHDDLTIRVRADRSDAPRGDRYDYVVASKLTAGGGDFVPVIDGHVVRFDDQFEPRDGLGIVRFHFDNLNTLQPARKIDGKVRVAFRKANKAHQVRVRAIGVETPDDPYFPKAAAYEYVVLPNESGAMRWFSNSDVKKDGAPYENVAVHSAWRADKSGIGSALVIDGSLDTDYWHLAECWNARFVKGFDRLATPDFTTNSGDPETCFNPVDQLEEPAIEENLADEDPEIPAALPEEQSGQ